jgi:hypothetical protein
MEVARAHYLDRGWAIEDVSATRSYDLHASKPGEPDRLIEVKATTTSGEQVVLTENEARNAIAAYPNVALALVYRVRLETSNGAPIADGGTLVTFDPWKLDEAALTPISHVYQVPAHNTDARRRLVAAELQTRRRER